MEAIPLCWRRWYMSHIHHLQVAYGKYTPLCEMTDFLRRFWMKCCLSLWDHGASLLYECVAAQGLVVGMDKEWPRGISIWLEV